MGQAASAIGEGSPPRGRGRRQTVRLLSGARRLTPAWAGTAGRFASTACRVRWLTPAWAGTAHVLAPNLDPNEAHPRVGGDGDAPADSKE